MHIISTNDGLINTQGKPAFKNQEFFSEADTGSHVVASVCLVLKLVMLLCVFVRFLVQIVS